MKDKAVSMILEYLILASILSVFVLVFSLSINSVLEETQLSRVVENQFSDVSSQISSQVVDMLAIYPRNGNLSAKIFMPLKIGDVEYSVRLEGNQIKIVSEDGRFFKYLSLGAVSQLGIVNMTGLTYSLKESHEIVYTKMSCIFPTAAVKVIPASFYVPNNFTIDVSDSSPGSVNFYEWRFYRFWNKTWSDWYTITETKVDVYVDENMWNNIKSNCNYDASKDIAECELSVEVRVYCDMEYLTDTANSTIIIASSSVREGFGNISVEKYVTPPQLEVGDEAILHIRLDGKGISGGRTLNLTAVLALDSSGSMGDLNLVDRVSDILDLSTLYDKISGRTENNGRYSKTISLPTNLSTYQFVAVEIADSYKSSFNIREIDGKKCWQGQCECNRARTICYVKDVGSGSLTIEFEGSRNSTFEALVYISKMDSLKLAAMDYVNSLEPGDFVGLVEYDDKAVAYLVNNTTYLRYLTTNKSAVVENITKMTPDGATNIYHALWKAKQTILDNTTITGGTIPLIILMTDGWPTVEAYVSQSDCYNYCVYRDGNSRTWDCPKSCSDPWSCVSDWWYTSDEIPFCRYGYWCRDDCYSQLEQLAEQIKNTKINGENIRICTIGFGRSGEFNETLLYNLASEINETTKCYFTAQTDEELKKAFRSIKELFEIVATNITITDVIPEYVEVDNSRISKSIEGIPVCDSPTATKDSLNRTVVTLNCSEIRINDIVDLKIPIKIFQPGTFALDVPNISNVTYINVEGNTISVPLKVVSVRYGKPGEATVEIR